MKTAILLKTLSAIGIFSMAVITTHAHAENQYSTTYNTCMDNSGGITVNIRDCTSAETKIQDARLNSIYQQLIKTLPPKSKTKLRNAQRAWIKYRDKEVASSALQVEGGTLALIIADDMYLGMTSDRADELQRQLDNYLATN